MEGEREGEDNLCPVYERNREAPLRHVQGRPEGPKVARASNVARSGTDLLLTHIVVLI